MSRGLRNNNPGNIRHDRDKWQGEIVPSQDKSFKQFSSMAYGYRALIKLLQNYRKLHNRQTIAEFINRYAPPCENNTSGYITRVCSEMQVPSTYIPDIDDKATMCAFATFIYDYSPIGYIGGVCEVYALWYDFFLKLLLS